MSKRDRLDRTSFMNRAEEPGCCVGAGGEDIIFIKIITRLSGSRPEGNPEGKMKKITFGEQCSRDPTCPPSGPPTLTFPYVLPWSLFPPKGYQSRRNTESQKVPGRESRGFRKDCRKDCRKQHRDKRINNNLHVHVLPHLRKMAGMQIT